METLGKERDESRPGEEGADSSRFHLVTQKGTRLKIYELFFYGIFHLIVSDHG